MKLVTKTSLYLLFLTSATTALAQTPTAPASTRASLTPREIAQQTLPSVVLLVIDTGREDRMKYGSGFFIAPDLVVTNSHVLEGAVGGVIKLVGQKTTYEILGTVGLDVENDLALIKVRGAKAQALAVGNSAALVIGDEIFAVGNPKGLEGTFSQGIVSSIRREGKGSVIQITAPISPGSSGGPVLNAQGEVVGVAVGGISSGQALNFAIPSSYLNAMMAKQKPLTSLQVSGQATRRNQPARSRQGDVEEAPAGGSLSSSQPSAPRSSASPRLSNEGMAMNRAASSLARRGSQTSLKMTVVRKGKTTEYVMKPGDCIFEAEAFDFNHDGEANGVSVEISCLNSSNQSTVRLDFRVMTNQRLEIGGYPNANWVHPRTNAAGMNISFSGLSGSSRLKRSFQIHQAQFDFSAENGRVLNLGISFEESSPDVSVNGTLYLNYSPLK